MCGEYVNPTMGTCFKTPMVLTFKLFDPGYPLYEDVVTSMVFSAHHFGDSYE